MRLIDIAIKPRQGQYRMYHLRTGFEAEIDGNGLEFLRVGLRDGKWDLHPAQAEMYEALLGAGFIDKTATTEPDVRDASPLLEAEVEVAATCNLRCRHCFAVLRGGLIAFPLFEKIVREVRSLGAITMSLNGGEPTLHPDLIGMVASAAGAGLRVRLFTNGIGITQEYAHRLKSAGLTRAYVSLETFGDFHDWLRGAGTWGSALHGTRSLLDAGVEVIANATVTARNLPLLDEFQKFVLEGLKASGVKYGIVVPLGEGEKNWTDLSLPVTDYPAVFKYASDGRSLPEGCSPLSCQAGVNQLFFDVRGDVYPCHLFALPEFRLGTLEPAEAGLKTVYQNTTKGGKLLWEFPHDRLTDCIPCQQRKVCGGGCRARALQLTGDLFSKDPVACARHLGKPLGCVITARSKGKSWEGGE